MCRPIRVLWLIDSLTAGGAEALTASLASSTADGRLDLRIVCLKSLNGNPFEEQLRDRGIAVENLAARNLRDWRAFRRLLQRLRSSPPDLIHAHLTYAWIWGALAARLEAVPLVATLHTLPEASTIWSRAGLRQRLAYFLLRRQAAAVLAVSTAVWQAYSSATPLAGANLRVLHNGVDVEAFSANRQLRRRYWRSSNRIAQSLRVVTTVAVLRSGKGIEDLLQAARGVALRHPDVVFLIAGDGPQRVQLAERCRALGLTERVRWLGHRREVADILAASDVFVLSSRKEALPTVLLEALATGLPAVATSVGGVPEIVGSSESALLVPAGEPAALEGAILRLLEDRPLAERLAATGVERIREAFSLDRWIANLTELYREILGAERPPAETRVAAERS